MVLDKKVTHKRKRGSSSEWIGYTNLCWLHDSKV